MKASTFVQSPIEKAAAAILRNAAAEQTEFTAGIIAATASVITAATALVAATPVITPTIEEPVITPTIEETEAIIAAATIEDNEEPLSARNILTERYFNAQDELAEIATAKKIMDDEEKAAKKAAKAKTPAIETLPSSTTFVKNIIKLLNNSEIEKAYKKLTAKKNLMYSDERDNFFTYVNTCINDHNTVINIYNLDSKFVTLGLKYTLRKNATSIETYFIMAVTNTKAEALAAVAAYGSAA